ncbi:MAG: prepilin-type N-terminal cleavage/methylation domain-containing protein [Ruminococcus flavefaciens]|nr:prepilin-type N-terminal cleavage/methylation domain-containing protein [Ruminococcus flavefaciens]
MKRLSELKERKKLDNKGFSLVELIIVIAIMAVLIGVLAPQYLKYVEKSRTATDGDNAVAIQSALQVWASDPEATSVLENGNSVVITRTGTTLTEPAGGGTPVADALKNAGINIANLKLTNKSTYHTCTITYTVTGGVTDITIVTSNT